MIENSASRRTRDSAAAISSAISPTGLPASPIAMGMSSREKARPRPGALSIAKRAASTGYRAGAAEGVEEGQASVPARKKEHPRRDRLLERGSGDGESVAAFVERLSGAVESQDAVVGVEIDAQSPLPAGLGHANDLVYGKQPLVDGLVDDGLNRSLRGETRVLDTDALDDELVVAAEVKLPGQGAYRLEELVEVESAEAAGLDEHALGRPEAEIGSHQRRGRLGGRVSAGVAIRRAARPKRTRPASRPRAARPIRSISFWQTFSSPSAQTARPYSGDFTAVVWTVSAPSSKERPAADA